MCLLCPMCVFCVLCILRVLFCVPCVIGVLCALCVPGVCPLRAFSVTCVQHVLCVFLGEITSPGETPRGSEPRRSEPRRSERSLLRLSQDVRELLTKRIKGQIGDFNIAAHVVPKISHILCGELRNSDIDLIRKLLAYARIGARGGGKFIAGVTFNH